MHKEQKRSRIYLGYLFTEDKSYKDTTTYYDCSHEHCDVRLIVKDGSPPKLKNKHFHPPDPLLNLKENFISCLKHAVMYSHCTTPVQTVYKMIRENHEEAAAVITWPFIESRAMRWRRQVMPPNPTSLSDFNVILQSDQWNHLFFHYNRGRMIAKLVTASDDSQLLLMMNPDFAAEFSNSKELFVDATFQVTPRLKGVQQLFVIMAEKFDDVFPIAWAPMERQTTSSYVALFRAFNEIVPTIDPAVICGDYEAAIRAATAIVYKQSHFQGCSTHLNRAIERKCKDPKYVNQLYMQAIPEFYKIKRKLACLPYLPAGDIEEGFNMIKELASPDAKKELALIFTYYEKEWMQKVTPQRFSVYRSLRRTTNNVESHNSLLFNGLGTHPSIWEFCERLTNVLSSCHADYESLKMSLQAHRAPRRKTLAREDALQALWDLYDDTGMPVEHFLEEVIKLEREVAIRM